MVDETTPPSPAPTPDPTPAPAAEFGTKASKEVLDLCLAVGKAVVAAESDGKISLSDLPLLLSVAPKLGPALADLKQVPAELEHLDPAEAEELVAYVVANLAVSSQKAQHIVAASLKVGVALFGLYKAIRE